jgi:hypothetical protein
MALKLRVASRALFAAAMIAVAAAQPVAAAQADTAAAMRADLDGKAIALADVGMYFCEDFTAPVIHCFSTAASLEAAVTPLATTATDYVVVYEYTSYAGNYMYISQDYTILATLGWNDRISSFIAKNGQTGHFFTDWFYSGASYGFCCNHWVPSLGGYDNTFSSVHRL